MNDAFNHYAHNTENSQGCKRPDVIAHKVPTTSFNRELAK
jgi:hypothetical protein